MRAYELSKSTVVRGMQCEKSLYLYRHHYDWQDEISDGQQAIFDKGHDIGPLAQGIFPGGADMSPEHDADGRPLFGPAIQKTSDAIKNGKKIIYEAAVVANGVLAAVDILVLRNGAYHIYEVKSGGAVNDTYATDAAIQYYVLTEAGMNVKDVSIVHLNKEYVRKGDIRIKDLFTVESVLPLAKEMRNDIADTVRQLKKVLAAKKMPDVAIGQHCEAPYRCSFYGHCWKDMPEDSVFTRSRFGKKAWELFDKNIVALDDIPKDYALSGKNTIELASYRSGKPHIEKEEIREFLAKLTYPLYFLDFETMMPAVPLFDGTHPYQTIAFQYSMHRIKKPGAKPEHFVFLGDGKNDPREKLVRQLIDEAGKEGDILMYTPYERTRLNALADELPKYRAGINAIVKRLVDLSYPFSSYAYYSPAMKGKYSIKCVYPAIVKGGGYDDLDIADGSSASRAYESLHYDAPKNEVKRTRTALLKYCERDTVAMLDVLRALAKL